MSENQIDQGGDAFPMFETSPTAGPHLWPGMTRRQWLAGLAMQGMLAFPKKEDIPLTTLVEYSHKVADAMLQYEKDEVKK